MAQPVTDATTPGEAVPSTLAGFRNRHRGQIIVVCGCGKSLADLRQPERFVTIGVNDVGRLFDPTYLVVVNPRSQFSGDRFRYVEESRAQAIFTQLELGLRHPHVIRFALGHRGGIDLDRDHALDYSSNSPYVAVLLALRMGAARVALAGVDFTDDHFFARTGRHPLERRLPEINEEYRRLAAAAASRGVALVNLSASSRLTTVPHLPATALETPAEPIPRPAPRIFFVNYRFLACGDVFATGLSRGAEELGSPHSAAWWDDPALAQKIERFDPDLVFVVHGRRAAGRLGSLLKQRRSAVWLLDEPYEVDDTSRWSSLFSTVFVNDASTLHRHRQAHVLPVCYEPRLHSDPGGPRDYDVGFVGGYNPVRERYLGRLAREGLLSYVVGGPWHDPASEKIRLSNNTTPEETARLYQRTRLVINVFRSVHHFNQRGETGTSLNPRIFEALACGAMVVSEPRPSLVEMFPEIPTFNSDDELVQTVRRLLNDPAELTGLLAASRARLDGHSYATRLSRVIEVALGADPPKRHDVTAFRTTRTMSITRPAPSPVPAPPPAPRNHAPHVQLPSGWEIVRGSVVSDGDVIHLTALPGVEGGLTTSAPQDGGSLSFDVLIHARARFIAKIQHADKGSVAANSYHFIAAPERCYLARHDVVLATTRVSRQTWQRIELGWHDGILTGRINDVEFCRIPDATLTRGHAFIGVCDGGITIRDVRVGPARRTSIPPDGWTALGPGTVHTEGDCLILSAESGPVSLVSDSAANDTEIECALFLDPAAQLIVKLHHQSASDERANSYHLVSRPDQGYLARHRQVLGRVSLQRRMWQRLRMRWVDQCLELFVDNRLRARIADNLLQSGHAVIAATAGRVSIRGLTLRDLSDVPQETRTPALRISAPRPGAPAALANAQLRHLLYHVWPVRGETWRWNVEQLLKRIDLFNGRRIIGIVHDARSEEPDAVQAMFEGHGCEFITMPNGPRGEGLTFPAMLGRVRSLDPDEVTFYAHAKGVKYEPTVPDPVKRWAEAQYCVTLDDWASVRSQLSRFALTGSFKMLGRFRAHHHAGDWHYSGTFFWMRHALAFQRDVERLPAFYGCVEAWPGIHFRREESGCLFLDGLRQLPYHPEFWRDVGDRALEAWRNSLSPVCPPENLQTPAPFEDGSGPRLEQHPSEFAWWLDRLVASEPRSLLTIGCMQGGVEWHVARRFRALGRDIAITAVDVDPRPELLATLEDIRIRFGQRIELVAGDSAAAVTREQIGPAFDAVFIDGDHGYRGSRSDLEFALTRGPRLIGLHDIVDSDWHAAARCCVSRVWREAQARFRSDERTTGDWGGIGVLTPQYA